MPDVDLWAILERLRSQEYVDLDLPPKISTNLSERIRAQTRSIESVMKGTRYSEEQIVRILREAEGGQTITETCRKHGIAETTFFRWRERYAGMSVSDVAKMKRLEAENARLKRLLAERDLEIDAVKDLLSKKW